jgi:hypothetical protein
VHHGISRVTKLVVKYVDYTCSVLIELNKWNA